LHRARAGAKIIGFVQESGFCNWLIVLFSCLCLDGIRVGDNADLVVGQTVIVELKCCESLVSEHQAQLFNYLKVSQLPIGLLVNFRHRKLEWKRLQSNEGFVVSPRETALEPVPF